MIAPSVGWRRNHGEHPAELLAFCSAHPVGALSAPVRERLLTRLVSGPGCILDLFRGEERLLVGVVVDTLERPAEAVVLDPLGQGAVPEEDWAVVAALVLDAAEQVARAAARPSVEVNWPHPLPAALAAAFADRRYRLLHCFHFMERAPAEAPPAPVLPAGWRWREVDASLALPLRRLFLEAFTEFPVFLSSEAEFVRGVVEARLPSRLLFHGEAPVGLVTVRHDPGDGYGEVAQLARHPAYRGRGLGEWLLAEALRLLHADGATRMRLEVAAGNERALALYQRFGFTVVREAGVYRGSTARRA